jgi:predicted GNAT family acetyltransferase
MSGQMPNVIHKAEEHRYEISTDVDGVEKKVGHLDYEVRPGEIHFTSTQVTPSQRGKNLAAMLTKFALDDVRAQGNLKVVPICSYTVRYMELHPETQDLLLNPIEEAIAFCALPPLNKTAL